MFIKIFKDRADAGRLLASKLSQFANLADVVVVGLPRGGVPPQYLYVRYELYTPGTGKTKSSGNVYQRGARGPGGMPVPLPRSNGSAEYLLRNCGREMADRVMDAISVARPPDR